VPGGNTGKPHTSSGIFKWVPTSTSSSGYSSLGSSNSFS